jgi:YD repeat-containing protein
MRNSKKLPKILLLFSAALLFGCSESTYKNSLQEEDLKGNVKKINQLAFSFIEENGKTVILDTLATDNFSVSFNELGNETERHFFAPDGQVLNISRSEYDENGRKKEQKTTDLSGNVSETLTFTYNNKGQCTEQRLTDSQNTYIYNNEYDSDGNAVKTSVSAQDGTPLYLFTSIYENKLPVSGRDIFYSSGSTNETSYKHDEQGREVEMLTRFINAAGVPVGQELRRNIYEDDAKGNWIRKKVFVNGTAYTLFERTIEYY